MAPRDRRERAPVRVAFLQADLGVGGVERLVQALVMHMDPARATPVVMNLNGPGPVGEELASAGHPSIDHLAHGRWDPRTGARLRAALERERIDVVHVCDSAAPLFWAGWVRRRAPRPKLVLAFHSTGKEGRALQNAIANRVAFPVADRFIALGEGHLDFLANRFGLNRARFDVLRSGVDLEAFRPAADRATLRRELGLPAEAPLVGIVAALRPEKHHALFVAAAEKVHRRMPGVRFLVIGDGPGRAAVAAAIAAAGLQDVVRMLGMRRDVARLWPALDVAALTSHPRVETLPVTLLEAHACGVPAVATNVGSVGDIVLPDETGFLVPPGDVDAFADGLVALLTDPRRREAMGRAARLHAERRFDRRSMLRAYEDLFVRIGAGPA
jgi:glycosyltransferase involved in cell wall biosynthesis